MGLVSCPKFVELHSIPLSDVGHMNQRLGRGHPLVQIPAVGSWAEVGRVKVGSLVTPTSLGWLGWIEDCLGTVIVESLSQPIPTDQILA